MTSGSATLTPRAHRVTMPLVDDAGRTTPCLPSDRCSSTNVWGTTTNIGQLLLLRLLWLFSSSSRTRTPCDFAAAAVAVFDIAARYCGRFGLGLVEVSTRDTILLVERCGLNAMTGKAKAGCPIRSVQATLDCLTAAGFRVAFYEFLRRRCRYRHRRIRWVGSNSRCHFLKIKYSVLA